MKGKLALSIFFLSFPWLTSTVAPWPMMLQDGRHSGSLGLTLGLTKSVPDVKWSFDANAEVETSAVLSETMIFAAAGKNIFALDKVSGEKKWSFKTKADVLASGALGSDAYFIGSDDHNFYAIQQDSGKLLWKFKAGEFTGGVAVDEDESTVYVGSSADKLHAYFFNGTKRFEFAAEANVASTPAVDSTGVYFGADDGVFYKLDRLNGEMIWRQQFESGIRSPARLHDDGIFIGIGDPDGKKSGEIIRLDYYGAVVWKADCKGGSKKCGSCWTSPAVVGGIVIAGCGLDVINEGHIWGLDKESGALKWSVRADNDCQTSSPVVVGQSVLIGCTDGFLYAIRASDGHVHWKFKAEKGIWATPALDTDGSIYVGSHDGRLYSLSGKRSMDDKQEL